MLVDSCSCQLRWSILVRPVKRCFENAHSIIGLRPEENDWTTSRECSNIDSVLNQLHTITFVEVSVTQQIEIRFTPLILRTPGKSK
jgi:hypothetical protein